MKDRRGPWALTDTGFCLTAVRDADPLDVVAAYAGSPNAGKLQTHAEALDWAAGTYGEVLVRIGVLPPWAFALELTGSRGTQRPFLEELSAQHEVVSYFTTGAMTVIQHFRNGECLENSEIGTVLANPFSESHYFFDRAERLKRKNGLDSQAGFSAVEEFIGARITEKLLRGPLLSLYVSDLPPGPVHTGPPITIGGDLPLMPLLYGHIDEPGSPAEPDSSSS